MSSSTISIHELVNNYLIRRPPVDYYKNLLATHLNSLQMSTTPPLYDPSTVVIPEPMTIVDQDNKPIPKGASILINTHIPSVHISDITEDLKRNLSPELFNKIKFVGLVEKENDDGSVEVQVSGSEPIPPSVKHLYPSESGQPIYMAGFGPNAPIPPYNTDGHYEEPPSNKTDSNVVNDSVVEGPPTKKHQAEQHPYGYHRVSHQIMYNDKGYVGHMCYISSSYPSSTELNSSINLIHCMLGYYNYVPNNEYIHVFKFRDTTYKCGPVWHITERDDMYSLETTDGVPFARLYFKTDPNEPSSNTGFGPSLQPWRVFFHKEAADKWIKNYHIATDLRLDPDEGYVNRSSLMFPRLIDVIEDQHRSIVALQEQVKDLQAHTNKHCHILNNTFPRVIGPFHFSHPTEPSYNPKSSDKEPKEPPTPKSSTEKNVD